MIFFFYQTDTFAVMIIMDVLFLTLQNSKLNLKPNFKSKFKESNSAVNLSELCQTLTRSPKASFAQW